MTQETLSKSGGWGEGEQDDSEDNKPKDQSLIPGAHQIEGEN